MKSKLTDVVIVGYGRSARSQKPERKALCVKHTLLTLAVLSCVVCLIK